MPSACFECNFLKSLACAFDWFNATTNRIPISRPVFFWIHTRPVLKKIKKVCGDRKKMWGKTEKNGGGGEERQNEERQKFNDTPLFAPSSWLWSDQVGARRRRAKALRRRAPLTSSCECRAAAVGPVFSCFLSFLNFFLGFGIHTASVPNRLILTADFP